ncbi:unnamed protein product, partial [Rhizoctonia solani]
FSEFLLSFLEEQPSITKLGWHGPVVESDADLFHIQAVIKQGLLPNLEHLEGTPLILNGLLPLRPISSTTILYSSQEGTLEGGLARSLVPITRVCIAESPTSKGRPWLPFRELSDWLSPVEEIRILTVGIPWGVVNWTMLDYPRFLGLDALNKIIIGGIDNGMACNPILSEASIHSWMRSAWPMPHVDLELCRRRRIMLDIYGLATDQNIILSILGGHRERRHRKKART